MVDGVNLGVNCGQTDLTIKKDSKEKTKQKIKGAAQIAAGAGAIYKGVEHGLPRLLGVRIEYHTAPKENAKLIKKAGNILNPEFGGKNGMSSRCGLKIARDKFEKNSKGFIHITGVNSKSKNVRVMGMEAPSGIWQTINRKEQNLTYKIQGGLGSKRFCIPGIDSYFDKNFISDTDTFALKTTDKLKCYNNRFCAMIGGLKEFGLKGMKENKSRVILGAVMITLAAVAAVKLIKKGVENIKEAKKMEG